MTIELIIEFVIALGALIFIHEFGHFIVCKILHIEVEEFGFGYPPRALTLFEAGGTKFTLNWLPFGGFVRPKGEQDPDIPGGMAAANPWKRIAVLLAGPIMNLALAMVLFITIYGIIGLLPDRNRVQLVGIVPNSPADAAGLQSGDILVSVNGVPIHNLDAVKPIIMTNPGKPIDFVYERNGATQEVSITPQVNPGSDPTVGIYMNYPMKPFTFLAAIPESFNSMYDYMRELFSMVGQMIRGQSTSSEGGLVGIVGMFKIYSSVRESAGTPGIPTIVNVFLFFASISISLGLLNLLPIPALDGGRILFALPEIIIRKRIPPKYEAWVNFISFALLILLMIIINAHDIISPITITPTP
ncbi:MAG: M50 family metallopeptidase [Anaerolineales bacterium]